MCLEWQDERLFPLRLTSSRPLRVPNVMATLQTSCLFYILLINMPRCVLLIGAPSPPTSPRCRRPCDARACSKDIKCEWSPSQEDPISTNYRLHWKGNESHEQASSNNIIGRSSFHSDEELRVWVLAKNQNDSAKSPEAVFNVAEIIQPPPPDILPNEDDPFEIRWSSSWASICDDHGFSVSPCRVQYRTEADQGWHQEKEDVYAIYTIEAPLLCTAYDVRVSCRCSKGVTSEWSTIHTTSAIQKAPDGELDVWSDCGVSHTNTGCILTWKRLPVSEACGSILSYEIRQGSSNITTLNVSSAEPAKKLICDEVQCHLATPVELSILVSVSASNGHGATRPSYLKRLGPEFTDKGERKETEENKLTLHISMNADSLTVFWNQFSQPANDLKAFVVQYKQFGSDLGKSFDWARLNKSQTTAFFRGQFQNYTAYQVSLFTLSNHNEVQHISSAFAYSLQKVPSKVPSFTVSSLGDREVTLLWEPVPILQQHGLMQYYEIGVGGQNVRKLNASPQDQPRTYLLDDLSPGQEYIVWIRAVNAAGPGENVTTGFTTKDSQDFGILSVIIITILLFLLCAAGCCVKRHAWKCKVPDPNNSRIFREMKLQPNDSLAWICNPLSEPHPTMSSLEILTSTASHDLTSDHEEQVRNGSLLLRDQDAVKEDSVTQECDQKDDQCRTEAYRKIVDSDEEKDLNSSDEEEILTGYERHFMPTAVDILEVSN